MTVRVFGGDGFDDEAPSSDQLVIAEARIDRVAVTARDKVATAQGIGVVEPVATDVGE